jgi:hypothetical protein
MTSSRAPTNNHRGRWPDLHRSGDAPSTPAVPASLRVTPGDRSQRGGAATPGWVTPARPQGRHAARPACTGSQGQDCARCFEADSRLDDPRRWLRGAYELVWRAGTRHEWLHADLFSALLEQGLGDPVDKRWFAALVPEFRRSGNRRCLRRSLLGLGQAVATEADAEMAARYLDESVDVLAAVGATTAVASVLGVLGSIDRTSGDPN